MACCKVRFKFIHKNLCDVDSLTTNLDKDIIVTQLHPLLLEDPRKDYVIVAHMNPIDVV